MPPLGNRRNQQQNQRPQSPFGRFARGPVLYVIVLLVLAYILLTTLAGAKTIKELTLTDYLNKIDSGQVATAEILNRDQRVQGKLKDQSDYRVAYPTDYADDITNHLTDAKVPVKVNPQQGNPILSTIINFLPFLLLIGFFFWIMNNSQAGGNRVMNFGKTRAKMVSKEAPKVTFKDVAGVDEAVEELVEIKEFLETPAKFQAVGAKIPKGVLLYGPPGSGKTLLARAVAGEAGVPFLSISGSDFVEMFVGVGAARVRDLFEQAKNNAPAIVFVDEIDAVGRQRGAGLGGGHDEREQTLNQLLVEMDGFDVRSGVIMIAATNRPDILDPALLRPGRFDRQIVVDRPDLKGRLAILNVHARGKPIDDGVELEILARRTPGFTGADLANVMNEAALLSARRGLKQITMNEMEESIDRVIAGPQRKSRVISDREKKVIAYHEAGHALVGHALPNADPVHKISIIPRGRALGYTLSLPTEDRFLVTRSEMIDELAMFLGGRVAEELVFEDPTTGAQDDIDRATKMARQMVTEYGMSAKLGPMALGQKSEQVFLGRDFASHPDYSENIAFEIDKEIRRLLDESFAEARAILVQYRPVLDKIVDALIEHETVEKELLQKLLDPVKKRPPRDANGKSELSISPAPRKTPSTPRKNARRNGH
ncbi:MAG: ATP-dependent metallopeptidase FtsH/Yme1/Tma family protein [Actinobacteria bacterium]|nr:MAG: ATP-dependent metallopeptidase FtsH/Yme1/Tma family protein [Actinomycetota bacterium]